MEVILLEKIARLGDLGDKVSVKPGYGRNYLLPQKKAVAATGDNLAAFEARREELERAANATLAEAKKRAEALAALTATVTVQAGEEGKLYGSVTVRDIAKAVQAAGVQLEKSEIRLPEGPIRELGDYRVAIHLHAEVRAQLALQVVAAA